MTGNYEKGPGDLWIPPDSPEPVELGENDSLLASETPEDAWFGMVMPSQWEQVDIRSGEVTDARFRPGTDLIGLRLAEEAAA